MRELRDFVFSFGGLSLTRQVLARLLEIEPSVDNVDNLADVYKAAGMKAKAAEVYKNAVNAAWSGEVPSSCDR